MLKSHGRKVLNGKPHYFVIEEIGDIQGTEEFRTLLTQMMQFVSEEQIKSASIVLNRRECLNPDYVSVLESFDFEKYETQYFYRRGLAYLNGWKREIPFILKPLEPIDEDLFKEVWKASMSSSLNAPSPTSIHGQFEGMKAELGPDYAKNCVTVLRNNEPIGVTMPHIEPGTVDEGRLFYFGMLPEFRGKGYGKDIHLLSLQYLKEQIGASYYIGATGCKNIPMQNIFKASSCHLFDQKVTYKFTNEG